MARVRPSVAPPAPPSEAEAAPDRIRWALIALAAVLAYGALESLLWPRALWGAHALGFLPRPWLLVLPLAALAFVPGAVRVLPAPRVSGRLARWAWPLGAGLFAAVVFWLVRERHLFWGDARPLSILVPQGQAFHPDEPLTLWLHHASWSLGGGRWSAADAIAAGSAIAGGAFVAWCAAWLLRRTNDTVVALLATAVLASQGFAAVFHGHVENYAWVALALLVFVTSALDFVEGRGGPWTPLLALAAGFAFHLLAALALAPAALMVAMGAARRETRGRTLAAVAGVTALAVAAAWAARGAYEGSSPLARLWDGVLKVVQQPRDMTAESFFSLRHLVDAWSHMVQMGPLAWPLVAVLLAALATREWLRRPSAVFALVAALAMYGPAWLTGEGNLGAARNWDLFAAPSVAVAVLGLVVVLDRAGASASRRVLLALLAVSLAQAVPWTALNASLDRTSERVAALPLGRGRAGMMLGTHHLNAGELERAEHWFRRSLAEDSTNVNSASGLGLALARQERYAEAEAPMRAAVELKPASVQFRHDLAMLELQLGRPRGAIAQMEAVLAQVPDDSRAFLTLAGAYRQLGHPDTAVFVLSAGRNRRPNDPAVAEGLADAYALWVASAGQRGDAPAFERAWRGFSREFPNDRRVLEWRARIEGGTPAGR